VFACLSELKIFVALNEIGFCYNSDHLKQLNEIVKVPSEVVHWEFFHGKVYSISVVHNINNLLL